MNQTFSAATSEYEDPDKMETTSIYFQPSTQDWDGL